MSYAAVNLIPFSSSLEWFSGRHNLSPKCSLQIITEDKRKLVENIREKITKGKLLALEMSPSAYDTAWVAMVPSRGVIARPSFPQCLDWIMENQNPDGSWGLDPGHLKDSLSCTLACLIALRKWNTGSNQLLQRGIDFIESNGWAAMDDHDDQLPPPIGFDIVFPAMTNMAKELDLTLPLPPNLLHSLLHIRDSQIKQGKWEYVAEGVVDKNWKQIIELHQRRNGSLFNSPATTAAALIHSHDHKCFNYLATVLQNNKGFAPTMYPMDIYGRLCMIDTMQRLGIDRYFEVELTTIFDDIYRNWQEREEEMLYNVPCRALAFRLLRRKGYNVSSDELAEFVEEEGFFNSVSMQFRNAGTVLELYRASQTRLNEDETTLDKINAWTKPYLKQQLLTKSIRDKRLEKEVEYDLKNYYGTLYRFQNRRTIDLYNAQSSQMAKTAYRYPAVYNEDLFRFAIEDFGISRAEYLKEFELINKWYSDCRFDLIKGRNVCRATYILTAAFIVEPELSMARISFTQVIVLITIIDDFFDDYGSKEEAFNIINLIKEWKPADSYSSKEVEIMFTAVYDTLNEIAARAHAEQGYCSKQQLVGLWVELLECAVREKYALSGNNVSTLEEYLSFAPYTIACKACVMTSMHFLGVKLSEEIWSSEELSSLCMHGSIVCRLLNDLKTYKRETNQENTINSVNVQTVGGGVSEEEAVAKVKEVVEYHRRKVMQVVCGEKGSNNKNTSSIVPRECKELVWKSCKMAYCFYDHDDGVDEFSSPQDIVNDMNAMMFDPFPGC